MGKLCVGKLCVSKLCVSELCVSKLCVCVSELWRKAGGRRKDGRAEVQNQRQEPHTMMWGIRGGGSSSRNFQQLMAHASIETISKGYRND